MGSLRDETRSGPDPLVSLKPQATQLVHESELRACVHVAWGGVSFLSPCLKALADPLLPDRISVESLPAASLPAWTVARWLGELSSDPIR